MKAHTNDFKEEIKKLGRQLNSKITYTIDNQEIELGSEDLNSVTPHYESNILKSVSKQLDVDSNIDIPVGTIINYQFGLLVNGAYEYINYGNYIVYKSEKQEDTNSYKLTCYDKMLYAMKDYENLGISYPITIKDYLVALCTKIGLTLGTGSFVNDTKQIQNEKYLDSEGNSLGYTYRDVLDEIAEVTASTILINNNDELELRYIEDDQYATDTKTGGNEIYIPDAKEQENIISYSVDGATEQDGTPTPDNPVEVKTIPSIMNLFDNSIVKTQQANYNTITDETILTGKKLTYTGSTTTSTRVLIYSIMDLTNYVGSTIRFKADFVASSNNVPTCLIGLCNADGSNRVSKATATTSSRIISFVVPELSGEQTYLFVGLYINNGGTINNNDYAEFTNIMLTIDHENMEYVPYGYYSRVRVTGKNIFDDDMTNFGRNAANTTLTKISNGFRATFTGTTSTTNRYSSMFLNDSKDLLGKTYTLSGNITPSSSNDGAIKIFQLKNDGVTTGSQIAKKSNNSSVTFTFPSTLNNEAVGFGILFYSNETGTVAQNDYVDYTNVQLELGESSSTYEPYKENQVLIDMSKENLFDKDNPNVLISYVSSSGVITASSGVDRTIYIPCKPNTTYTILKMLQQPTSTNRFRIGTSSEVPTNGITLSNFINKSNGTTDTFQTITTGNNANYLCAFVYTSSSATTTLDEMLDSIKIYESNNPTPYYELCKIGDYKDTLSIDSSGNIIISKNVGKVVLNGSENIGITENTGTGAGTYRFYTAKPPISTSSTANLYSNYFTPNSSYATTDNCVYFGGTNLIMSRVIINGSYMNVLNDFKTWLNTHNVEVYYPIPLSTPETINLPNTKIPLFEGINHVTFVDDLETSTSVTYTTPEIGGEIIDEEYLKDINVNFGEEYGSVNTIVLSRSAGADKISQSIPSDLPDNEKVSIVIEDNQILNGNDRDIFIPEILNKLYGLHYYLNDFSSTGITYLDICDRYHVKVGDSLYSCVMFNDEIDVAQGLQELIHTDMPETSETDYKKTDKTDQRINQTYLIVDKQNQTIESVVSNVTEQNSKISQITQTVDEINQKIGEITDITVSGESLVGDVSLNQVNASEPITIKIRPLNSVNNISYLYPNSSLYPSNTLYPKNRKVRFIRTYTEEGQTKTENIDYELPDDLLYYDSTHYDEFYLNYDSHVCQVTKKCKYNSDGSVGLLSQEEVIDYPYPTINLGDGDYEIKLLGYDVGYLFVTLMASNIYTTQFATKVEMESSISQTAQQIELDVSQTLTNYSTTTEMNSAISIKANEINSVVSTKVGNNEVISKINQTPETITINANKINIAGTITAINNNNTTTINGNKITTGSITASQLSSNSITADKITANTITASKIADATITGAKIADATITSAKISNINADKITAGTITTSAINLGSGKFSVNTSGYLQSTSGKIGGWTISSSSLSVTWGGYTIQLSGSGITASGSSGSVTASWYEILRRLGFLP